MIKNALILFIVCAALAGRAWGADAPADLAKSMNCLSCHAVAVKVLGPSYRDVAAKYAGQKDAEAKLVQKVLNGGSGVWGMIAMPANTQVSEADAHVLVKWVLSQK
jgi:cytochrome c